MTDEQCKAIEEKLDTIYAKLFEGNGTPSIVVQLSQLKQKQDSCHIDKLTQAVSEIDKKIYLASGVMSIVAGIIVWVADKVIK